MPKLMESVCQVYCYYNLCFICYWFLGKFTNHELFQTILSFAPKKVKDRTKFYPKGTDFKKLHEALGKDVLPEEYGGNAGPIQKQIGSFP